MKNSVLITGCAGYVGSVMAQHFLSQGYKVRGYDNLMHGGASLLSVWRNQDFHFVRGDIRSREDVLGALKGIDAVVHLAAIVGDPACARNEKLANEVNLEGAKTVFEAVEKTSSVKRFIFASTCSNYGKMKDADYVTEESPLTPVSLYAKSKVEIEKTMLASRTREDLVVTPLRFSTVYGASPRMRFDLTINEFARDMALKGEVVVFGEQFWRPYIHVSDVARACQLVFEAEVQKVQRNVFNVGDGAENYQKKTIVEMIQKFLPEAKVSYVHKTEDPRDYRVNFSKIQSALGFQVSRRLEDGIVELIALCQSGVISNSYDAQYTNTP